MLELEGEKGEWGFKALKQMIKINFKLVRYNSSRNYLLNNLLYNLSYWIYTYIYTTHTHTHTRHFIRYTLLVPGWPPFAFRTALILRGIDSTRCWKHSSEILVHIDMIASRSCCRFVGCTSMMWISCSTTSQRCSIGLRSGDCGGHLSKVNSL